MVKNMSSICCNNAKTGVSWDAIMKNTLDLCAATMRNQEFQKMSQWKNYEFHMMP